MEAPRPPILDAPGTAVVEGPNREGSELRWLARREDGSTVMVAMLAPELSHDVSVRRRWVADVERVRAMDDVEGLLPVIEVGPSPDPRDPDAAPPWRIREHWADAETLDAWLNRRAPLPQDEAAQTIAAIATIVHAINEHGAVLRDLHPRRILVDGSGRIAIADVGLTRVDILSSRTAASLILEGSPYAAPEQFTRHAVDQRSDVYGLGVLLFRALTGTLPFGDQPAILRPPGDAPKLGRVRPGVDSRLETLVARCLAEQPERRPDGAGTVANVLRGDAAGALAPVAEIPCQSCGHALRPGQRLCTHCGKQAVRFTHAEGEGERYELVLKRIGEDAQTRAELASLLGSVGNGPPPPLNFLVGDQRMYSKAEQQRLLRLPMPLFSELDHGTAEALSQYFAGAKSASLAVRPVKKSTALSRAQKRGMAIVVAAGAVVLISMVAVGLVIGAAFAGLAFALAVVLMFAGLRRANRKRRSALMRLRDTPAALPASDPLVARLAALLQDDAPADVRDQVGALALGVQTLVDHRAANRGEAEEIDAVTAPVERLVGLMETQVRRIAEIDAELADLDESTLVRAIAAAKARGTDRDALLAGLDRLRTLEDARAATFHRLLQAGTLIRRATELGLSVHDEQAAHEREVALALATLSGDLSDA